MSNSLKKKTPVTRFSVTLSNYREEGNINSFAHGLNFYKIFWIFLIGNIIGYCVETIWCFVRLGYYECRQGLIYGPFIPVYGLGAVLLTVTLYRYRNRSSTVIFLASSIIGAAFEYVCSLLQEIVFGTVSWEYSDSALNLHGRTNVFFAICWGFLGLVFITHSLPTLTKWIESIPNRIGVYLTWILIIFMIFDIFISAAAVKRQDLRRDGVPAGDPFSAFLDEHYDDDYLKRVFPNMQAVDN